MARLSESKPDMHIRPRLHTLPLCFIVAEHANNVPGVMRQVAAFIRRRGLSQVLVMLHPDLFWRELAEPMLAACTAFQERWPCLGLASLSPLGGIPPDVEALPDLNALLNVADVTRPKLIALVREFMAPLIRSSRRVGATEMMAAECAMALASNPRGTIGIVVLSVESFVAARIDKVFSEDDWASAVLPGELLEAVAEPEKLARVLTCSFTRLKAVQAIEGGLTDDDCLAIALDLLLQTAIRFLAWKTKEMADAPEWVPCPQIPAYFSAGLLQEMPPVEVQRLCDAVLVATVSKRPSETHALKRAGLRVMLRYVRRRFGGGKRDPRQAFEALARHVLREAKPKEPFMAEKRR
jgi:hypothetical protein